MDFIWQYMKKYKKYLLTNFIMAVGFIFVEIGIPTVLARGINNNFKGHNREYIMKLALTMLLFSLIGLVSLIVLAYSTNKLASSVTHDIREDVFSHVQTFSKDDYDKFGVSKLMTITGSDAYTIMQFLIMILRTGFMAPMMFITSLVMIFSKSPSLGLVTVLSIPIMVLIVFLINQRTKPLSEDQQRGLDSINRQIRESLTGIRVIRAFNNEDFKEGQFLDSSRNYADISKRMFQTVAFISPVFTLIFAIVTVAVLQIGATQVHNQVLQYGTLVAFIEYVFHALMSFLMLSTVLMMYPRTSVSVDRIREVLDTEASIVDRPKSVVPEKIRGRIEFKDVSFSYSTSSEKSVLNKISFEVDPGETVAFIGSTGSGKSTVIKLIPRLMDSTEGQILIDGRDIRDYQIDYLRSQIAYVPQKSSLFSGTIMENLRFGNREASFEEIEEAAEIAQALDFIKSSKEGYDRILAEGGSGLSGGQQQRLCIARALTRDVPIYIFDDSFSALDYKTDYSLRKRLREEIEDRTKLIVAQRVSTIMDADKIVVLDSGEFVDIGSHKELLKRCEIYYEIASSQLTKEELEL